MHLYKIKYSSDYLSIETTTEAYNKEDALIRAYAFFKFSDNIPKKLKDSLSKKAIDVKRLYKNRAAKYG
jgi:hypothetical protein